MACFMKHTKVTSFYSSYSLLCSTFFSHLSFEAAISHLLMPLCPFHFSLIHINIFNSPRALFSMTQTCWLLFLTCFSRQIQSCTRLLPLPENAHSSSRITSVADTFNSSSTPSSPSLPHIKGTPFLLLEFTSPYVPDFKQMPHFWSYS